LELDVDLILQNKPEKLVVERVMLIMILGIMDSNSYLS